MSDSKIHDKYITDFLAMIRDGRDERVRDALLARLDGRAGPPLGRDEPDGLALLLPMCRILAEPVNAAAMAFFRRILVEVVTSELIRPDWSVTRLRQLSWLVGYCKVVESLDLADQLRFTLWGFLTARLPQPFELLLRLAPQDLARARLAFDIWLAVTPPDLDGNDPSTRLPAHQRRAIADLFGKISKDFKAAPTAENFDLVTLLYRGVLKTDPSAAGLSHFWHICGLAAVKDADGRDFRDSWNALCWEQGRVLTSRTDWRAPFFKGLEESQQPQREASEVLEIARGALDHYGPAAAAPQNRITEILQKRRSTSLFLAEWLQDGNADPSTLDDWLAGQNLPGAREDELHRAILNMLEDDPDRQTRLAQRLAAWFGHMPTLVKDSPAKDVKRADTALRLAAGLRLPRILGQALGSLRPVARTETPRIAPDVEWMGGALVTRLREAMISNQPDLSYSSLWGNMIAEKPDWYLGGDYRDGCEGLYMMPPSPDRLGEKNIDGIACEIQRYASNNNKESDFLTILNNTLEAIHVIGGGSARGALSRSLIENQGIPLRSHFYLPEHCYFETIKSSRVMIISKIYKDTELAVGAKPWGANYFIVKPARIFSEEQEKGVASFLGMDGIQKSCNKGFLERVVRDRMEGAMRQIIATQAEYVSDVVLA